MENTIKSIKSPSNKDTNKNRFNDEIIHLMGINKLRNKIDNLETKFCKSQDKLNNLEKENIQLKQYEAQNIFLKNKINKYEEDIQTLKDNITKIENDNKILENNLIQKENENKSLRKSITEIEKDKNILKDNLSKMENDYKTLKNNLIQIENDKKDLQNKIIQKESDNNSLKNNLIQSENNNKILRDNLTQRENDNKILRNNLTQRENDNKILINNLSQRENDNKQLNSKINFLINKNEDLENKLNEKKLINNQQDIFDLIRTINIKEEKIKELESIIPYGLKKGEKLMSVIFQSVDQIIHHSLICKNTDNLNKLENILFEKYLECQESNYFYLANGIQVNKFKTLDELKIKDGEVITMKCWD